jgi:hypothetical protein
MNYFGCSAHCWRQLVLSPFLFYKRIVSQLVENVQKCWKETYKHCLENCDCWLCWCAVKGIFCIIWQTIVNVVCTLIQVVVTIVEVIFYVIWSVLAVLRCIFLPCPIGEHAPPVIRTCDDLLRSLRSTVNDALSWWERASGMFSTSAKETGLSNTWDEYDFWIDATGTVVHDAYSTDGLETIDIHLLTLDAYDNESYRGEASCSWPKIDEKYIRVEVYPSVSVFYYYSGQRPQPGNTVEVKGRLYWDRDGFLEIHPQHGGDLRIIA